MKRLLPVLLTMSLFAACGQQSEESSSTSSSSMISNPIVSLSTTINTKAEAMSGIIPLSVSGGASAGRQYHELATQGFSSEWTTTLNGLIDERTNGTGTSPKEWMGIQVDDDAERPNGSYISVFGRLKQALDVVCAVGIGLGTSGSVPANDTYSITLSGRVKTAIESQCDMDIEGDMDGATVGLTIEDAESTDYYDKKMTITPMNYVYYFRTNASEINVAFAEVNSNGIHRTVVAYDITNKLLKVEYISGPSAALDSTTNEHLEAFRLYIDETNDKGYLMAMMYDDKSPAEKTHFILAGRPVSIENKVANETVALSFLSDQFALNKIDARQACVDVSNGNITSDNSLSCSITGLDVDAPTTAAESLVASYNYQNYDSVSASTNLSFTDSDFDSALFSSN